MEKDLFRISEVALKLSICKSKAYELVASGEIRSLHIGRSRRVASDDLYGYIEKQKQLETNGKD